MSNLLPADPPQLSLNMMFNMLASTPFRIYGNINHHQVMILVNGGSIHNLVQAWAANFLALSTTAINPLQVMVGDGGTLIYRRVCPKTPLTIQGYLFRSDLFVLGISGANLVLGVQWLQELGSILIDYTTLTMTFSISGCEVPLCADVPFQPTLASAHQVQRLAQTQGVLTLFQLTQTPDPTHTSLPPSSPSTPTTITHILSRYDHLFQESTELPPSCPISHHIHIFPTQA